MMRCVRWLLLATIFSSSAAFGQDGPQAGISAVGLPAQPVSLRMDEERLDAVPQGMTQNLFRGVNFDFNIDEKESKAAVTYGGYRLQQAKNFRENSRVLGRSWELGLAIPLGGADDLISSDRLDALSGGWKLSGSLSFFNFTSAAAKLNQSGAQMDEAEAVCRRWKAEDAGKPKEERREVHDSCDFMPSAQIIEHYLGRRATRHLYDPFWRFGVEGAIALDRFDYITLATLDEKDAVKPGFSIGGFFTYYPSDRITSLTGRAEYQNAFEAEDAKVLCKPVVVKPDDDCKTGVPGAPKHVERLNLTLDLRHVIQTGSDKLQIGLGPKGSIDALGGEWEAEFPVYLIIADSKFLPAVSLIYSSEKDKFDLGLFLRASFTL